MKIIFIHNPSAGNGHLSEREIFDFFRKHNHEVIYYNLKNKDYRNALSETADAIIIAGGDGTVGKISKKLIGRNIPIQIIPSGTANNIAKSLGIHSYEEGLYNFLENQKVVSMDSGIVQDNCETYHFLESIGFGLFSHMVSIIDKLKKDNLIKFSSPEDKIKFAVDMMKRLLKNYETGYYHIIADEKDFSGNYILVEIMNISSIGPNLIMAPEAKPDDGYFDIVLVKEEEKDKLIKFLDSCLTAPCHDYLNTVRVKEISVKCKLCDTHVDDKFRKKNETCHNKDDYQVDLSVKANNQALKFLAQN